MREKSFAIVMLVSRWGIRFKQPWGMDGRKSYEIGSLFRIETPRNFLSFAWRFLVNITRV
ncbi:hypothetical protein DTL42_18460 [Bremerella cremea]|uniref:Uncharacterized protein n=1 Tax=Bremerella cremea TaxID=1031537 RepID=A0A368KMT1_9BACT|nr:hypothetical protein DTL42_18460 [Bremerella cremea]